MTISNTSRVAGPFLGNGVVAAFPFTFKVFTAADLLAVQVNVASGILTTLNLGADYNVTLSADQNASPGGTLTLNTPLAVGNDLSITSNIAPVQPLDLTNQGGFYPKVINDALDRIVIYIQQVVGSVSRSIKFPLSDTASRDLPPVAQRANNLLGFDANGSPIAVAPNAQSATALQALLQQPLGASLIGFQQTGTAATVRTLSDKLSDAVNALDFGVKCDGATDDAPALQLALNTGRIVILPNRPMLLKSGVTILQGGGLQGSGEASKLIRGFTGGRLLGFPGGDRQYGSPVFLRDFGITTASNITVVDGDTGIDIGYSTPWVGRGEIANIFITGQWDGFKWKSGTVNVIRNVYSVQNRGHGFVGINPRGELQSCLAQGNYKCGYFIYSADNGETGLRLIECGTFANQLYGLQLDAAPGVAGANIWSTKFSSSFDGKGGIYCDKQYTQLDFISPFIEYAGSAKTQNPDFQDFPTAVGLSLLYTAGQGGVNSSFVSNAYISHSKGAGVQIDHTTDLVINGIVCTDNGRGLGAGNDRIGLVVLSNNVRLQLYGFSKGATTSNQSTDLSISGTNNDGLINAVSADAAYYGSSNPLLVFGASFSGNISSIGVTSASVITILPWGNEITVTGSVQIDGIFASWEGRKIDLVFANACVVSNGNNQVLTSTFTGTPNSTLSLVCKNGKWIETGRSIK